MCVPLRTTLPRVPIRMLGVILDQSLRVKAGSSAGGRRGRAIVFGQSSGTLSHGQVFNFRCAGGHVRGAKQGLKAIPFSERVGSTQ